MGVLLMLLTIGGLGLAILLMIFAGITRSVWLAKFIFGAVGIWLAIYAVLLVTVSLMSKEETLALNEPKEFCGFYFDCHLHAAVTKVRKTKTIGERQANGEFYVVTVKIFSDARRAELGLHAPKFTVLDAQDRRFERVQDLTISGDPFEQKVPAGGSFEGEVIFDLPIDAQNPRLDISEGVGIDKALEAVLIGDEDSLWHKRKLFKLAEPSERANR